MHAKNSKIYCNIWFATDGYESALSGLVDEHNKKWHDVIEHPSMMNRACCTVYDRLLTDDDSVDQPALNPIVESWNTYDTRSNL